MRERDGEGLALAVRLAPGQIFKGTVRPPPTFQKPTLIFLNWPKLEGEVKFDS